MSAPGSPAARTAQPHRGNRTIHSEFDSGIFHSISGSVQSSADFRRQSESAPASRPLPVTAGSPKRDFEALAHADRAARRQPAEAAGAGGGLCARQSRRDRLRHGRQHRRSAERAAVGAGALCAGVRLPGFQRAAGGVPLAAARPRAELRRAPAAQMRQHGIPTCKSGLVLDGFLEAAQRSVSRVPRKVDHDASSGRSTCWRRAETIYLIGLQALVPDHLLYELRHGQARHPQHPDRCGRRHGRGTGELRHCARRRAGGELHALCQRDRGADQRRRVRAAPRSSRSPIRCFRRSPRPPTCCSRSSRQISKASAR